MKSKSSNSVLPQPSNYLFVLLVTVAFGILGCASTKNRVSKVEHSEVKAVSLIDVLVLFREALLRGDVDEAVKFLAPEERVRIRDSAGVISEAQRQRLLGLSVERLLRVPSVRIQSGLLQGIVDLLPIDDSLGLSKVKRTKLKLNSFEAVIDTASAVNDSSLRTLAFILPYGISNPARVWVSDAFETAPASQTQVRYRGASLSAKEEAALPPRHLVSGALVIGTSLIGLAGLTRFLKA